MWHRTMEHHVTISQTHLLGSWYVGCVSRKGGQEMAKISSQVAKVVSITSKVGKEIVYANRFFQGTV